jgi:hypothetical protein
MLSHLRCPVLHSADRFEWHGSLSACLASPPQLQRSHAVILTDADDFMNGEYVRISKELDIAILWDIAPCSACMKRRFERTCRFHLQGRKLARQETSFQQVAKRNFRPWTCSLYFPPKRRFAYELHGAISQKMATFVTTAVRISNPACWKELFVFFVLLS